MDIDTADNLYVAEVFNHTIRKITPEGVVTTLAGLAGTEGYQDGMGADALFRYPEGIAVSPEGVVYVADGNNGCIRKIDLAGNVTTLVGRFIDDFIFLGYPYRAIKDGDGANAIFARTSTLKLLANGDLLVSGWGSDGIRKIQIGAPSSQIVVTKEIDRGANLHYVHHIDHSAGFSFTGTMENVSEVVAENAELSVKIFKGNQLRYLDTSETLDIEPETIEVFALEKLFEPKEAGTYDVEMQYKLDGVIQYELFDQIIVSDSIMSYDDGHYYLTGSYSPFIENFPGGYGVAYDLKKPDTLTGIQLNFGAFDSTLIQFSVYLLEGEQANRLLYQSEEILLEEGYFGDYTHTFDPLALPAGSYLLTIRGINEDIGISFDNNSISDQFYITEPVDGIWTKVSDYFNGYVELTAMIRPVIGERPMVVNVSETDVEWVRLKTSPNPFTDQIQLELSQPQRAMISLYDAGGQLLKRQAINGTTATLNGLADLPRGMYIVSLEGAKIRQMTRVIKQ